MPAVAGGIMLLIMLVCIPAIVGGIMPFIIPICIPAIVGGHHVIYHSCLHSGHHVPMIDRLLVKGCMLRLSIEMSP